MPHPTQYPQKQMSAQYHIATHYIESIFFVFSLHSICFFANNIIAVSQTINIESIDAPTKSHEFSFPLKVNHQPLVPYNTTIFMR